MLLYCNLSVFRKGNQTSTTHFFLFWIAHISRDGRDLAILTTSNRVLLYRDFERISRGEIGPVAAGRVLRLSSGDRCLSLAFKHSRLCIATVRIYHAFHVT